MQSTCNNLVKRFLGIFCNTILVVVTMIINSVGSGGGGEEYCIVHIINLSGINDSFTQFLHVFTRGMQVNLKHSNKKHKIEFTKVLDSLCAPLCVRDC